MRRFRRIYRNRLSDWLDKWLFFVVFAVGAGGIVVLKLSGAPQVVVTAFPLAVMAGYAVYVFASPRYRLREDLAGDSLYYLGLLYTLTSLAYALYAFTRATGGTQGIISNFGVALATTITGLALRVVFTQWREDPVEIEREARLELAEAVAKLKTELNDAVVELNGLRRATMQSMAEGRAEMQELSRESAGFLTTMTQVREQAHTLIAELQQLIYATTESSRILRETLATWRTESAQQRDTIIEALQLFEQTLARFQSSMTPLLETFRTRVVGHGQHLRALAQSAQADLAAVHRYRQGIEAELTKVRALVGETHASLVSMISLIVDKLNGR